MCMLSRKKSLETLINESNDAINASTDEKILNGFYF